ncbi:deoxyribodipyrimidine photolyase [Echinicola sp. CAU 1574]|uniref:Deoxyribodipyrimidine photolyase n=1 Tax=Echinicola arenosa TaxID=2774144 RepID=A0ABR9AP31_9BACT|nr:FAD-binding domain-containing protein [Echinicola arenosa]MBD8489603.1 deoxyribodipyrimidine photolyase [Echinicola arenosa]
MNFPTCYDEIIKRVEQVNPVNYGRNRNFIDGDVTYLSPYISRGVISTRQVMQMTLAQGYNPKNIIKFLQELAWRDYWQQVWIAKGNEIDRDLKQAQVQVENHAMSKAIIEASTGLEAIDKAIESFYQTGYLHNHVRMYLAAIACNMGKSHWWVPARWMYYHLLDADWASNALSWQWVAGSNSHKKYLTNQENINKYCHSEQRGTFLDKTYEELAQMDIPKELKETALPDFKVVLPENESLEVNTSKPTLVYNFYNLDPLWRREEEANRILLLEPSHFEQHPVSPKTIGFVQKLAENIPGVQVFVGEFSELEKKIEMQEVYYKEHPLNHHYKGKEDQRDWMLPVTGYYPSFFAFWKKCQKELKV